MDEFPLRTTSSSSLSARQVGGGLEVNVLRDYVDNLEKQQVELAKYASDVKAESEQRARDQSDIYFYLNKKLDENFDVIQKLEEQLIREQADREVAEKEYEETIDKLTRKMANDDHKHSAKITDLEDKLEALKEFSVKRDQIDQEMKELHERINRVIDEKKFIQEDLEKKIIQEKRRLRQEFEIELENIKKVHLQEIDDKLSVKTKRTKIKNFILQKELSYQTQQAEQVLLYDNSMKSKDKSLRHEVEISQALVTEMENKLADYQRSIKSLNSRIEADASRLSDTTALDEITRKYNEKLIELDESKSVIESLKEDYAMERKQYGKLWGLAIKYYNTIKRGVRRPMNPDEIEENPDRFVAEVLIGAFEQYPSRFKSLIRSQTTAGSSHRSSSSAGQFWDFDDVLSVSKPDDALPEAEDIKWWSTDNTAYLHQPEMKPKKNDSAIGSQNQTSGKQKLNSPNRKFRNFGVQTEISDFNIVNPGFLVDEEPSLMSSSAQLSELQSPSIDSFINHSLFVGVSVPSVESSVV
jgi:hypothetical protein